jgi:hypothetical protein
MIAGLSSMRISASYPDSSLKRFPAEDKAITVPLASGHENSGGNKQIQNEWDDERYNECGKICCVIAKCNGKKANQPIISNRDR